VNPQQRETDKVFQGEFIDLKSDTGKLSERSRHIHLGNAIEDSSQRASKEDTVRGKYRNDHGGPQNTDWAP